MKRAFLVLSGVTLLCAACGSGRLQFFDGTTDGGEGGDAPGDGAPLTDTDGDTISDKDEGRYAPGGSTDTDGDTVPDYRDQDSDADGIPDALEAGDTMLATPPEDADSDGKPNFQDLDSDGNGIFDQGERKEDLDRDGKEDWRDLDDDGDNMSDILEIGGNPSTPVDWDRDGTPDFKDFDSDNDNISDRDEGTTDTDRDGIPDFHDDDSDGDLLTDEMEAGDDSINTPPVDTDDDGVADFRDHDSDGDGLSDQWEYEHGLSPTNADTDGDGATDLIEVGADTDPLDASSNPHSEGNFFFLVPYEEDPAPAKDTLVFSTAIKHADVYFLVDTTGSMWQEVSTLRGSIATTVIPGMVAAIPDIWTGVGHFEDYPASDYGYGGDKSYANLQNLTGDPARSQAACGRLPDGNGADSPESHVSALYTTASGDPSKTMPLQPPPSCGAGFFGYPCFRDGSVPIVILISDAPFHNGPGGYDPYSGVPAPTYAQTVAALVAASIKVIGVHSDTWSNDAHYRQLATDTGAVDVAGNPLVYNIPGNGSGLGTQVINAVQTLANRVPIEVTTQSRDDESDAIDALDFIDHIEPNTVDAVEDPVHPGVFCVPGLTTADKNGDTVQDTYTAVLPGTTVCFDIFPRRNDTVEATEEPQVFKAFVDVLGDGITVLDTREVFFLIPPEIEGPGGPD